MATADHDEVKSRRTLSAGGRDYDYFSLGAAGEAIGSDFSRLPVSLKVLLENLLRHQDGRTVRVKDIKAMLKCEAVAEPPPRPHPEVRGRPSPRSG